MDRENDMLTGHEDEDYPEPPEQVALEEPKPVTRKPRAEKNMGVVTPVDPAVPYVVLADLARPTPVAEIKSRMAMKRDGTPAMKDGKPLMLSYVDARYGQEVLDDVVGPANWQSQFQDTHEGVRCGIGINVLGVGWVWKWDAGVPSNIEPVKGAHSDAFKRACVQWGIARDLYDRPDDEVDQSNPAAAPLPTVQQSAQGGARDQRYAGQAPAAAASVMQSDTRTAEEVEQAAYDQGLAWACEIHPSAGVRYTAAGVTKSEPKRPYGARIRCGDPNCKNNGPLIP